VGEGTNRACAVTQVLTCFRVWTFSLKGFFHRSRG